MNISGVPLTGILMLVLSTLSVSSVHSEDASDMYKRIEEQTRKIKENNKKIRERNESSSNLNGYGGKTEGKFNSNKASDASESYIDMKYVTYRSVTADNLEFSLPILISAPDICGKIYDTKKFESYVQVVGTIYRSKIDINEIELRANGLNFASTMINANVKNELCHTAKYLAKKHNFNSR